MSSRVTAEDERQRRELGAYFRALREAEGLGQRELAEILGLAQANVSQFEQGKNDFKISTLQRFARAFGLSLSFSLDPFRDSEQENFNELLREAMAELEEENEP